jgi:hypothetical protein
MEIDKQKLIKLLETFADTTHSFERELALYRMIVQMLCQDKGLRPDAIQELVDKARVKIGPAIQQKYEASHQDLLGKLPRIVELLNSNQDDFLGLLHAWKPQGPVN